MAKLVRETELPKFYIVKVSGWLSSFGYQYLSVFTKLQVRAPHTAFLKLNHLEFYFLLLNLRSSQYLNCNPIGSSQHFCKDPGAAYSLSHFYFVKCCFQFTVNIFTWSLYWFNRFSAISILPELYIQQMVMMSHPSCTTVLDILNNVPIIIPYTSFPYYKYPVCPSHP